ncbi:hypothetical protein ACVWXU_001757 [Streptomyces sp. TE33382]
MRSFLIGRGAWSRDLHGWVPEGRASGAARGLRYRLVRPEALLTRVYAVSSSGFNSAPSVCDCLAHRFGNVAGRPEGVAVSVGHDGRGVGGGTGGGAGSGVAGGSGRAAVELLPPADARRDPVRLRQGDRVARDAVRLPCLGPRVRLPPEVAQERPGQGVPQPASRSGPSGRGMPSNADSGASSGIATGGPTGRGRLNEPDDRCRVRSCRQAPGRTAGFPCTGVPGNRQARGVASCVATRSPASAQTAMTARPMPRGTPLAGATFPLLAFRRLRRPVPWRRGPGRAGGHGRVVLAGCGPVPRSGGPGLVVSGGA